jgi:hypothetical protein
MPLPGRLDLILYQGDSFEREFLIEQDIDGVNESVDFTDQEVVGFIRTHATSGKVIGIFDISWPISEDGEDDQDVKSLGTFYASLSAQETEKLPPGCVYDIHSVDPVDEYTKTWLYGNIKVIRGVTRG